MNRQEPYIGMPIILASFDEDRVQRMQEQNTRPAATPVMASPASGCDTVCTTAERRQPMALAMAYVPWQRWQETYPLDEGLRRGTIFPALDLPFEGKRRGGMGR